MTTRNPRRSWRIPARLLSLLLLGSATLVASAADDSAAVALTHVTVVVGNGKVLDDATVVVRDGTIQKVGRNVPVPGDAQVVDGKGLFVYPGLIDALREQPAGGSVDPKAKPADPPALLAYSRIDTAKVDDASDAAWRKGGVLAASVAPDKGIFRGQSTVRLLGGGAPDLKAPAAVNVSLRGLGYHNRKLGMREPGGPFPNRLIGVLGFVRQTVLDARYLQAATAAGREIPAELSDAELQKNLSALAPAATGKAPMILPAATDREFRRVLQLVDDLDIKKPIFAGGHGANALAAQLAAHRIPLFFSLHFIDDDGDVHPEYSVPATVLRERWQAPRSAATLAQAGVPLAFYSDGLQQGQDFLSGLRRVVRAGLSEQVALRAATLGAAELLGVQGRLGSVEAGKIANLVVTDGNLFTDDTAIRMVFVGGRRYADAQGWKAKPTPNPFPAEIPDTFANLLPDLGPVVFIRNVSIMTVTHGTLEKTSMLVKDGKIAALGAQLTAPRGAHVIDGTGKWITPGLIDCHSHIGNDSHNDSGSNETSLANMRDTIYPGDLAVYRTLSAGVTAANLLHGSVNPIGGQTVVIKNRWGVTSGDEMLFEGAKPGLKFAIKEFLPREGAAPPVTLMGMEAFLRDALTRAQHYAQEWDAYEKRKASGAKQLVPPRRNLRLDPIVEVMRGKRDLHVHLYTPEEITLMIRLADEFGFKVRVFQHATQGYKVAADIAKHGGGASIFADTNQANLYNAAILSAHGIVVSVNSDNEQLARTFLQQVSRLRKYGGLSDNEALALVTLNPAKQLGVDDRVGSIDPGKDADFVLFNAHPLSIYATPQMVFIDGKLQFSLEAERRRQQQVDAIHASRRAAHQENE